MTIRKDTTQEVRRTVKTTGRKPEGLVRLQAGVITPANVTARYQKARRADRTVCRTVGACIYVCRGTGDFTPACNLWARRGRGGIHEDNHKKSLL
jgi:hypothetical protein